MKISNQANQVEITKWDITGDRELPGAELTLRDTEGSVIEHWISEETPHGQRPCSWNLYPDRRPRTAWICRGGDNYFYTHGQSGSAAGCYER